MAERIVNLALAFDAIVFGGYVRDVIVCGQTEFRDIDILWHANTDFPRFLRILELDYPGLVTREELSVKYSTPVHRVRISGPKPLVIDCCIYSGMPSRWFSEKNVDFTCNLFYKTREVQLGIRYVPEAYHTDPNPVETIVRLTKDRMYRVILTREGDAAWKRAALRGLSLANRGWKVRGDFLDSHYELGLTHEYKTVLDLLNKIEESEDQRAVDALVACLPKLHGNCESKIRRHLRSGSVSEED